MFMLFYTANDVTCTDWLLKGIQQEDWKANY